LGSDSLAPEASAASATRLFKRLRLRVGSRAASAYAHANGKPLRAGSGFEPAFRPTSKRVQLVFKRGCLGVLGSLRKQMRTHKAIIPRPLLQVQVHVHVDSIIVIACTACAYTYTHTAPRPSPRSSLRPPFSLPSLRLEADAPVARRSRLAPLRSLQRDEGGGLGRAHAWLLRLCVSSLGLGLISGLWALWCGLWVWALGCGLCWVWSLGLGSGLWALASWLRV